MAPTFMEIFFNHTDFLNLLCVDMLISLFSSFQGESCRPLCFLKRALLRLKNYHEFSRFFCFQLQRLKDTERNALDLAEFLAEFLA